MVLAGALPFVTISVRVFRSVSLSSIMYFTDGTWHWQGLFLTPFWLGVQPETLLRNPNLERRWPTSTTTARIYLNTWMMTVSKSAITLRNATSSPLSSTGKGNRTTIGEWVNCWIPTRWILHFALPFLSRKCTNIVVKWPERWYNLRNIFSIQKQGTPSTGFSRMSGWGSMLLDGGHLDELMHTYELFHRGAVPVLEA